MMSHCSLTGGGGGSLDFEVLQHIKIHNVMTQNLFVIAAKVFFSEKVFTSDSPKHQNNFQTY